MTTVHVPPQNIEAEAACPCGRLNPSYSHRLGRLACVGCYFGSIPAADREASDRGWARRDLATQVRHVAHRLPRGDARAQRLRGAALDLELAGSDRAAAPVIAELRDAGIALEVRS